jgi:hypothetical protein
MDDLSNLLDLDDDDDDDYIPESLASFVAEANQALADARLNFQDEVETPSKAAAVDQSMDDFPVTPVLLEDDDDRNLKKHVLGKLFQSLSEIKGPAKTPNSAPSTPAAAKPPSAAARSTPTTNLFQESFQTPNEKQETIVMGEEDDAFEVALEQPQGLSGAPEAAADSPLKSPIPAVASPIADAPVASSPVASSPVASSPVAPSPVAPIAKGTPLSPQPFHKAPQLPSPDKRSPTPSPKKSSAVKPPVPKSVEKKSATPVPKKPVVSPPPKKVEPLPPPKSGEKKPKSAEKKVEPIVSPPPKSVEKKTNKPAKSAKKAEAPPAPPKSVEKKKASPLPPPKPEEKKAAVEKEEAPSQPEDKKKSFWGSFSFSGTSPSQQQPAKSTPRKKADAIDLAQSTGDLSTGISFVAAALSPTPVGYSPESGGSNNKDEAFLPPASIVMPSANDAAFLPPARTPPAAAFAFAKTDDLAAFLPNNNATAPKVAVEQRKKTTSIRKAPKTATRGLKSGAVRAPPPPPRRPPPPPPHRAAPKRTIFPKKPTTTRALPKPPARSTPLTTKGNGKANSSGDSAMAKAKERVQQRQLMEKKKREVAIENKPPSSSNSRRIVTLQSAQEKTLSRRRKQQLEVEAKLQEDEERRRRVADRVRSYGAGKTIPKPLKLSISNHPKYPSPKATPSASRSVATWESRPKLTTPKPFHFHGKDPVHPSPNEDKSVVLMSASMDHFNKGLRVSTPLPNMEGRPRLTTPKPFRFNESKAAHASPATKKKQLEQCIPPLAERLDYINKHMREPLPKPPTTVKRDLHKPTIPKSPSFTPVAKREKVKSTEERDKEMMEYYNSRPFRATPIMSRLPPSGKSNTAAPKVTKKKLTVSKPFRLSTDSRGAQDKHLEMLSSEQRDLYEAKTHHFHARPAPNFKALPARLLVNAGKVMPIRSHNRKPLMSPKDISDLQECKKQFHAKPMPDFSSGSKLISSMPSPGRIYISPSRRDGGGVPLTIEVRQVRPIPSSRIAPSPSSPSRITQPKPFRLSKSNRESSPAIGSDEKEKKTQFKARYLPITTFIPPDSVASPAYSSRYQSCKSNATHSTAPKLMTGERVEQREGAVLASRINAELMSRERATAIQRLKVERHEEEMKKASMVSPTKLMAASMTPFHLETDTRHETYQKKFQEKLDEEDRDRREQSVVKALPMPHYKPLSATKSKPGSASRAKNYGL